MGLEKDEWPEEIKHKTQEFTAQLSEAGTFIDDCFIKTEDEKDRVSTEHVYDIYIQWCIKNKFQQKFSSNQLTRKLVAHGFIKKPSRIGSKTMQCFVGIQSKVKIPK